MAALAHLLLSNQLSPEFQLAVQFLCMHELVRCRSYRIHAPAQAPNELTLHLPLNHGNLHAACLLWGEGEAAGTKLSADQRNVLGGGVSWG